MQAQPTATSAWLEAAKEASKVLVGAAAVVLAWILSNLSNRKSKNEIHQTDAVTDRTEAETDDIRIRTGARVGEIVSSLAEKLGETQILVGELRTRVIERDETIMELRAELSHAKNENEAYEKQRLEFQAMRTMERFTDK